MHLCSLPVEENAVHLKLKTPRKDLLDIDNSAHQMALVSSIELAFVQRLVMAAVVICAENKKMFWKGLIGESS